MSATLPSIKEFPDGDHTWRIDWFGAVERNHNVPSEPKIQLIVSPLLDGSVDPAGNRSVDHAARTTIAVGVGQLPLLSIGTLWRERRRLQTSAGTVQTFRNVAISPDTVRLVRSDAIVDGDQLVRMRYHRIGAGLSSYCLAIEWQGDPYGIVVPTAEVIRFYYATSSRLAKAVFAGAFRHDINSLVNPAECGLNAADRHCYIKLRQKMRNPDAWVIGRVLFDRQAYAGATLVHDSLIGEASQNRTRLYPKAGFPFRGTTTLRARVKPIQAPDGKKWRYLVFALEHCTGPFPYSEITCARDNDASKANPETDLPDDEKEPAFPGGKPVGTDELDGELQSDDEPSEDVDSVMIGVPADRFAAIAGLELQKPEKEMCHYISAGTARPLAAPSDQLGTGDGTYSDTGVTPAVVETIKVREQPLPATFQNFLEAIRYLNERLGTLARIRPRTDNISHIPLTSKRSSRQWSYLESKTRQRRAVVIADILHGQRMHCLIEFQWRESESFKLALVSVPRGNRISDLELEKILLSLARAEGRWENIKGVGFGLEMQTLKHVWPDIKSYAEAIMTRLIHS